MSVKHLLLGSLWVLSVALATFLGWLSTAGDGIGWNYVEQSFTQVTAERDAMKEFVFERSVQSTDMAAIESLSAKYGVEMHTNYENWRNSYIGLVKFDIAGKLVGHCFSDLDYDSLTCEDAPVLRTSEEASKYAN